MMSVARGDNIEYGSLIMGYMYGYSHVLASIGDIYIHKIDTYLFIIIF